MSPYNQNKIVRKRPTITAGAYSANDVVGGLVEFNVSSSGGGGTLRRVTIADDDNEKAAMTLYFFTAARDHTLTNENAPTSIADNGAFAPVIGDLVKLVGVVPVAVADYVTVNGNAYAILDDLGIDYETRNGILYMYAVCTGMPSYTAATDLTFSVDVWQD